MVGLFDEAPIIALHAPDLLCETRFPRASIQLILNGTQLMASTLPGLASLASVVAATLYVLGSVVQFRRLRQERAPEWWQIRLLAVPAIAAHAIATYLQIVTDAGLYLGLLTVASLITLLMAVFVMLAATRLQVGNLLLVTMPLAALGALASAVGETRFEARETLAPTLIVHILFSIFAYSVLFMAACQSVLLACQERRLRQRTSLLSLRWLPPLETMETLLFALLWTGILTLTVAIATGFAFLDDMFDQRVVHHTVLALISWTLYAVLLAGRHFFGWRSRTATYWTLIAFSLLVLGYFGSKFVLEVLLASR
jgi:ABC-type uncharacterized transport system permease subunit